MIRSLSLKIGPSVGSSLSFDPSTMTIFVGPNGSGKSLTLRELLGYIEAGDTSARLIVDKLAMAVPSEDEIQQLIKQGLQLNGAAGRNDRLTLIKQTPASSTASLTVSKERFERAIRTAREDEQQGSDATNDKYAFAHLVSLYTAGLDGKSRLRLVEERELSDLQKPPANHLSSLFKDDSARDRVREIVFDAFGTYFVLDPTLPGKVRIRLSTVAPATREIEQSLTTASREYHAAAQRIEETSDGVKSFVGIISSLASADFRVFIIDEPEAFLHPPLARKLGNRMATMAAARHGNVFAATHSAEYLMGAVEAGHPLNIVRMTYQGGQGAARLLPASEVLDVMRDPLMRSADVMSALFHEGAVVCEADSDRCFYQELNFRLSADGSGIKDSIFVNVQNKQTVRRVVEPLRRMGIAAAAIVDLDIIKGGDLTDLLRACNIAPAVVLSLGQLKGDIAARFRDAGLDMDRGGVSQLTGDHLQTANTLLTQLRSYGVFVVPNGSLESWFPDCGLTTNKSEWLGDAFNRMGSDPDSDEYMRPTHDGPWEFIRSVSQWIHDPNRLGMPFAV